MSRLSDLFSELQRRKVVRTAVIYAALAWAGIEVVTTVVPVLGGAEWLVRLLVVLILLGLPVAIGVSWAFDFTPEGFRPAGVAAGGAGATVSVAGEAAGGEVRPAREATLDLPPPVPSTPLVGREEEVEEVAGLLTSDVRAVTVTGPGGTGKTRVAIAVADRLRNEFPAGLAFVSLAAVTDPIGVVPAIAAAVGVKEAETRSLTEGLTMVIGERRLLLVLDNLEQVIEAAPELASLLARCPALRILATSRAPLRIGAEIEYPLRPLALPPAGAAPPVNELERYPAVALFLERTRQARPDFRLTPENAEAVVQICRRLDGLPLALELAAARLRMLEPRALAERLEHALDVLTTGARDLPRRQRTLRATIDWSHSMLEPSEQRLFRCLAVFAGGWTYEAVEAVCYEDRAAPSLDELESLVDKALVQRQDGADRFVLLETIREFAREQLEEHGEVERTRQRHARYFLAMAEELDARFRGPEQVSAVQQGDQDEANLNEALVAFRDAAHAEAASGAARDAAEAAMHMCGHLWFYWHVRGLHISGREWARTFLDLSDGEHTLGRARALRAAGLASWTLGDFPRAIAEFEEAVGIAERLEHAGEVASATFCLGVSHLSSGAIESARSYLEEGVEMSRRIDAAWQLGMSLSLLGMLEAAVGKGDAARAALEEALAVQEANGDREGAGLALGGLAGLAAAAGDHEQALELHAQALASFAAVGDRPEEARIMDGMAWSELALDLSGDAREHFVASLRAYEEVGSVRGIGLALLGLAAAEAVEGRPRRAVRIAAAAEVFSEQEGIANDYAEGSPAPAYLAAAREDVPEDELAMLETEGRELSVREAVNYAVEREVVPS